MKSDMIKSTTRATIARRLKQNEKTIKEQTNPVKKRMHWRRLENLLCNEFNILSVPTKMTTRRFSVRREGDVPTQGRTIFRWWLVEKEKYWLPVWITCVISTEDMCTKRKFQPCLVTTGLVAPVNVVREIILQQFLETLKNQTSDWSTMRSMIVLSDIKTWDVGARYPYFSRLSGIDSEISGKNSKPSMLDGNETNTNKVSTIIAGDASIEFSEKC